MYILAPNEINSATQSTWDARTAASKGDTPSGATIRPDFSLLSVTPTKVQPYIHYAHIYTTVELNTH